MTEAIYARTRTIERYLILEPQTSRSDPLGERALGAMTVEVVDPVADYAALMERLFDFDAIRALRSGGFRMRFDAMHAVTGPYAARSWRSGSGRRAGHA